MRWGLFALAMALVACDVGPATVDGIRLAQARGAYDPPATKTSITITGQKKPSAAAIRDILAQTDDEHVRLIIAMDVPWQTVDTTLDAVVAAGKKPVILVGKRKYVKAIHLSDQLSGAPAMQLTATMEGKICLSPPDTAKAKCVRRYIEDKHIDRAFTRGLVREGVEAYGLYDVELLVPGAMDWADVVRAVDGARTCCGDTDVRVKVLRE